MDIDMAVTYLQFVEDRHSIWESRQLGEDSPWATDPILASRKFTNVYRVLDPGTQFFVSELMVADDPTPRDVLARAILYRHTNRPEPWVAAYGEMGRYPLADDMNPKLAKLWCGLRDDGLKVFSNAYMILAERQTKGVDKTEGVIRESRRIVDQAWPSFGKAATLEQKFYSLFDLKGMGPFMSMQVITDYGYAGFDGDQEDGFIILGPGAKRGARAIAPGGNLYETFHWAVESVRASDTCPVILTPSGKLRKPSYMDVQNTFCEMGKYVRFMGKPLVDRSYKPAHPGKQDKPVLPAHW